MHFLITILDEDYNGSISLEEYYFALDTYNSRGEVYAPYDDDKDFVPFVNRAMYKLVGSMRERDLSNDDLFRMIDISNDELIQLDELENVVKILNDFKKKELHALH
jgi:Ca2+-binding EF-hand superfamily protein